jgi:hypothetical protein
MTLQNQNPDFCNSEAFDFYALFGMRLSRLYCEGLYLIERFPELIDNLENRQLKKTIVVMEKNVGVQMKKIENISLEFGFILSFEDFEDLIALMEDSFFQLISCINQKESGKVLLDIYLSDIKGFGKTSLTALQLMACQLHNKKLRRLIAGIDAL